MKQTILLTAYLLLFASNLHAQSEDPPIDSTDIDTTEMIVIDSIIFQSANRIAAEVSCAVRYASNADIYLRWSVVPDVTGYMVRYSYSNSEIWNTVQIPTNEVLIEGVPLDTVIVWEVIPLGLDEEADWESDVTETSTFTRNEPVIVSSSFYNRLEAWFGREYNQQGFCELLDELTEISQFEKLAFLQTYAFDNAVFVKPQSNTAPIPSYFPTNVIIGTGEGQWCIPVLAGPCRCKVVSRGSNLATPNAGMLNHQVKPKKFDRIIGMLMPDFTGEFESRSEAGAAKFATLKQDRKSGGNTLIRSNLPISGDQQSVTTETSELAFFLACLSGNGVPNTNLPLECNCVRPLHIYYEYTTTLRVKAKKRSCIFSKGSEASAEDWAFIGVYRGKTGDITPVDAGRATLNTSCSSNWNPDFWVKLLDVLNPVAQYYVQTLDSTSGNKIPTSNQINQFINGLQTLIKTPFAIKNSNGCLDEIHDAPLVTGSKTYTLVPNEPIRVTLFSAYYIRTRGYGCWKSQAGVASDYYLLGVVESEAAPINTECCAEKYANYIVGSQSAPFNKTITFGLNAVNSIANRLGRVGYFLSLYGGWNNLPTVPGSGIIVLSHEYDNSLLGPSCIEIEGGGQAQTTEDRTDGKGMLGADIEFAVFPSPTHDRFNVQISTGTKANLRILLHDTQGRVAKVAYSGEMEPGSHLLQLSVGDLPKGVYLAQCEAAGVKRQNFKIIIF